MDKLKRRLFLLIPILLLVGIMILLPGIAFTDSERIITVGAGKEILTQEDVYSALAQAGLSRSDDSYIIEIADGVNIIAGIAFDNCRGMTNVIIPASVTHIYYNAFSQCESLSSIIIPEGVFYIDFAAFNECVNLCASIMSFSSIAFLILVKVVWLSFIK